MRRVGGTNLQQERGVGGARRLLPRLAILFADCAILFADCVCRGGEDKQGGGSEEAAARCVTARLQAPPQHDVDTTVTENVCITCVISQYLSAGRQALSKHYCHGA